MRLCSAIDEPAGIRRRPARVAATSYHLLLAVRAVVMTNIVWRAELEVVKMSARLAREIEA